MKPQYCAYPFSHLYIEPRGTVGTCCAMYQQNDEYLIQTPEDLDAWEFHPALSKVRNHFRIHNEMLKPNCGQCIYHENSKKVDFNTNERYEDHNLSMRETMNVKFTEDELVDMYINPKIRSMHIKFGNLCNLACRTCSEESSNLLQKEFEIIYTTKAKKMPMERFGDLQWYEKPGVFEKLLTYTENLVEIHASGGEPLVNEYFWKLVKHCVDNGYSKNIILGINTNGTVTLKPEQIEILRSFKSIGLDVSQDGTGELAEYVRTRSSWEKFCKNMEQYKQLIEMPLHYSTQNVRLRMVITVSIYNVHKIDEVIKFAEDQGHEWFYQFVHNPQHLNVVNLNSNAKQYLENKYKNTRFDFIINHMNNEQPYNLGDETIRQYIDRRDQKAVKLYKNFTVFKELEPAWYNLL